MRTILFTCATIVLILLAGCRTHREFTSTSPEVWANIQPGMTKQAVHEALGEPQTSIPGEAKEIWDGPDRWKLVVTYNSAEKVSNALNSYPNQTDPDR